VLVKAGERIPADGIIAEGESAVDEAAITGEPIPVQRCIGDAVRAGTLNGDGTLEIVVDRTSDDFLIAHVARLVQQAQNDRSPAERYIDRFARWYTPAVVGLAAIVALVPPLFFNEAFLNPVNGGTGWLYRGLALLIIACPCALILSIPVTVVSALARLAQNGILVKGGAQLNELAATSVFAFDKTGTLTHGRPTVSGLRSTECEHDSTAHAACMPCDDVVAVAAAVESGSNHPLASAVMHEADQRQVATRYARASAVQTHSGRGVSGTVNGSRITIGNRALTAEHGGIDKLLPPQSSAKASLMIVSKNEQALGYLEVSDSVRPEAVTALQALRELDSHYRFVMLTGDNDAAAAAIADATGLIDEVHSELMPEQKLDKVRELESKYGCVAMVGDGINDTPALAGAKLGVAMGAAGSPQAMESADIVLMRDNLHGLVDAVKISRKTRRRIAENITLSLGLKLVFLALAIPGLATLWMAVLADVGTTLLVTLNGMRILREPTSTLR
jgi:Cd2+/Zn2+-exporting ATPase